MNLVFYLKKKCMVGRFIKNVESMTNYQKSIKKYVLGTLFSKKLYKNPIKIVYLDTRKSFFSKHIKIHYTRFIGTCQFQ